MSTWHPWDSFTGWIKGWISDQIQSGVNSAVDSAENKLAQQAKDMTGQLVDSLAPVVKPLVDQTRGALGSTGAGNDPATNTGNSGNPLTALLNPSGQSAPKPQGNGNPDGDDDSIWGRIKHGISNFLNPGGSSNDQGGAGSLLGGIWNGIGNLFGGGILGGIIKFAVLLIGLIIGGLTGMFRVGMGMMFGQDAPAAKPTDGTGVRVLNAIQHYGHMAYEGLGNLANSAIKGVENWGQKLENFAGVRGVRNNNPGDITASTNSEKWVGQVGMDGRFPVFDTREHGFRAMAKTLVAYSDKYGLNTVSDIMTKYAPCNENDTNACITHVSQWMGVDPNQRLNLHDPETLSKMMGAISRQEVGQTYSADLLKTAANDALEVRTPEVLTARNGQYPVQHVSTGAPTAAPQTPLGSLDIASALSS